MGMQRYSIMPAWVFTDNRIKAMDIRVLGILGRHIDTETGWCTRSQSKMAREMGVSRGSVQQAIKRLRGIGVVQQSRNDTPDGRDCSHDYRVLLDANPADLTSDLEPISDDEAVKEAEELGPDLPENDTPPPASILAPPASSGLAPPASSGLAPYKNGHLITANEKQERERASADPKGGEGKKEKGEDRRKVEIAFNKAFDLWPTKITDSRMAALKAWFDLSTDDRIAAHENQKRFVDACKATGRKHVIAFGRYLGEKKWQDLPEASAPAPEHSTAQPFGKMWGVVRMAALLGEHGVLPRPTAFIQKLMMQEGGEKHRLEHQAKHGWQRVNMMHEAAYNRRALVLSASDQCLEPLADLMIQVKVGDALWNQWAEWHSRMGRPWFDMSKISSLEWVYLPKGGADGLEAFEQALNDIKQQSEKVAI